MTFRHAVSCLPYGLWRQSHCVAQAGLELMVLLPQSFAGMDFIHAPPHSGILLC